MAATSPSARNLTIVSHGIVAHLAHLHPTLPVGAPWSLNPPRKLSISPPIRWNSTLRNTNLERIRSDCILCILATSFLWSLDSQFVVLRPLRSAVRLICCVARGTRLPTVGSQPHWAIDSTRLVRDNIVQISNGTVFCGLVLRGSCRSTCHLLSPPRTPPPTQTTPNWKITSLDQPRQRAKISLQRPGLPA